MTVFMKWRENGWSCMCELPALPACPLHPHANRDQANSEKNMMDISPTISIFSSIHTTKTSAPTSNNVTNHSSIHLINTTTTNNTLCKTKKLVNTSRTTLYIIKYTDDKAVCSLVLYTWHIRSTYQLAVFSHPYCTSTTLVPPVTLWGQN
jgi:hypothetical protein